MKPGIYDIPMSQYLALPYLSSGVCHRLLVSSPCHARFSQDEPNDPSDATDRGEAIHDGLGRVDRVISLDYPDWRKNEAKAAREEVRAAGKIPLLAHKAQMVKDGIEAAQNFIAQTQLAGIFDHGKPERTIIFEWEGVKCKARPDWLSDDVCLHVKTTQGSANPEAWIRNQLVNSGYDVSIAFYSLATDGHEHVFLVIEQNPPYGCSLVALTPAMHEIAMAKTLRAIRTWKHCETSGEWPSYPTEIHFAEPRPWELAQMEQMQEPRSDEHLLGGQA